MRVKKRSGKYTLLAACCYHSAWEAWPHGHGVAQTISTHHPIPFLPCQLVVLIDSHANEISIFQRERERCTHTNKTPEDVVRALHWPPLFSGLEQSSHLFQFILFILFILSFTTSLVNPCPHPTNQWKGEPIKWARSKAREKSERKHQPLSSFPSPSNSN